MSLPNISRINTPTGHWYKNLDTGAKICGVTTVLNVLPKKALDEWKIRKAVELSLKSEKSWKKPEDVTPLNWLVGAADRESMKAADVGTNSHAFAEAYMKGQDPNLEDLEPKERSQANCFLQFVRDHQPKPVLVEPVVVHIDPKTNLPLYCGTVDLVAELIDEQVWLVDYKGSASKPRPSHALQAAAYVNASHWIDDDGELQPMPKTDRAAVVLLNGGKPNKCYRMYRLDVSPVVFSVFKSLLRIHNFSQIQDRVVLGEME